MGKREDRYHYIKGGTKEERTVIYEFLDSHSIDNDKYELNNKNNEIMNALYYALGGGKCIITEEEPSGDSFYFEDFEKAIKILSSQFFEGVGYIEIIAGWNNPGDHTDSCEFTYFEGELQEKKMWKWVNV